MCRARRAAAVAGLALTLLLPLGAQAQSQRFDVRPMAVAMSAAELETALSGATLAGAYNFSRDGVAALFYEEVHTVDGAIVYTERELSAKGQWAVIDDTVCYSYDHPMLQGGCFRLYQVGNCFYYYSTSVPQIPDELERDYWVARATRDGETPTCVALIG